MNYYDEFKKINKDVKADGVKVTVVSTNFEKDLCITINQDGEYFVLPIEILISDMENDICHINDFSKLKNWSGFEKENIVARMREAYYPADYLDNKDKYVANVTDAMLSDNSSLVYNTIGKQISTTMKEMDDVIEQDYEM